MECNYTQSIILHKSEVYGLICLAVVGVVSVLSRVANSSYNLGKNAQDKATKKELKQCMKKLAKAEKKLAKRSES